MRAKCSDRRHAITAVATQLFCEHGYSHTTMSMIAARLGGSKSTLWSYFASKEELFAGVMAEVIASGKQLTDPLPDRDDNIAHVLHAFCHRYLQFTTSAEALMIRRTIISNRGLNAAAGVEFFSLVTKRLAAYLERQSKEGELCTLNPDIAAGNLIAVLEARRVEALLFALEPDADEDQAVVESVNFFLSAYAKRPGQET